MRNINIPIIVILALATLLYSCDHEQLCIRGNNNIQSESIDLDDFESVELDGAFDVYIKQGRSFEIIVTGDDNILPDVKAYVSDGILKLDLERGCYRNYDLQFDITMPALHSVHLDGSGNIEVDNFSGQDFLEAHLDGSGNIDLFEFDGITELIMQIDGSGDIVCNEPIAHLDNLETRIAGSGNIRAYHASADNATAKITGSGDIRLTCHENLDVRITGSGNVLYKGNPSIHSRITGSGEVVDAN